MLSAQVCTGMTMSAHDWMVGVMKMSTAAMNSGFFMACTSGRPRSSCRRCVGRLDPHALDLVGLMYSRHMSGIAWVRPWRYMGNSFQPTRFFCISSLMRS